MRRGGRNGEDAGPGPASAACDAPIRPSHKAGVGSALAITVRAEQHPPVGKSGAENDPKRARDGAVTIAPCRTTPFCRLPHLRPPPGTSLARARCAPATSTRAPAASPTMPPPGKRPRCCGRCGPRCPRGKPRRWRRTSWPRLLPHKRSRSLAGRAPYHPHLTRRNHGASRSVKACSTRLASRRAPT